MNKQLKYVLLFLLINKIIAQVSPYYIPFNQLNSSIGVYNSNELYNNDLPISFIENASFEVGSDRKIYSLAILFDSTYTGYLKIDKFEIPDGAMLFIFSSDSSYTGPYTNHNHKSFLSGYFNTKKLVLKYVLFDDYNYTGNFQITKVKPYNYAKIKKQIKSINRNVLKNRERPKIMITGYWPPTNEMVRHFSQDNNLNPSGWEGDNWEGRGYDVVSYFPEFEPPNCNNCGQGSGNLEVDYQDFSDDFWPIVESVRPIAIITFSRGYNDFSWELENRVVNRINWYDDYLTPFLPTPNPPDSSVNNYYVRYSSLPIDQIIFEINNSDLGLNSYLDNTNAGMFLSEFAGYHGVWYKDTFDSDPNIPCFSAGHIHVGAQIGWDVAKLATEITIRALIEHINSFILLLGDCNLDGQLNILDVIALVGAILGDISFSSSQFEIADIDVNGQLNILDIIALVNLILTL